MKIEEGYYENEAGEKFRYRENEVENPKAAVICVHGYAEHIGRYRHVEERLVARGMSFYMIENRGHGLSVGRKGHIDRYDQFIDDLYFYRNRIMPKVGDTPLFLLGHSNGSLISARYALAHGDGVRGMVLSGIPIRTAMKVNPIKLKAGMILAGIAPTISLPTEIDPKTLCHDKQIVDAYIKDPLVHKIMSVGFAKEFLGAMANLLERAGEFRTPALFMHGGDDRACDPPSAREFYQKAGVADKKFIMYDNLWHEIFNEPQKEEILRTAIDWIEERADLGRG